jgi:hypothetical protein
LRGRQVRTLVRLEVIMPRIRAFRHSLLAVALLLAASPAGACLPPPPGTPEPPPVPRDQLLHSIILGSTDIVSGRIVGSLRDGRHRFRVEQVYKGNLRPGAILTAWHSWGLDAPMCPGMIPPPPVSRGMRGTIFFYGEPELKFLSDPDMERILALGLLQRPPRRPAADRARPR